MGFSTAAESARVDANQHYSTTVVQGSAGTATAGTVLTMPVTGDPTTGAMYVNNIGANGGSVVVTLGTTLIRDAINTANVGTSTDTNNGFLLTGDGIQTQTFSIVGSQGTSGTYNAQGFSAVSIQNTSLLNSGGINFYTSNDGTNWFAQTLTGASGDISPTPGASGLYYGPLGGQYFRIVATGNSGTASGIIKFFTKARSDIFVQASQYNGAGWAIGSITNLGSLTNFGTGKEITNLVSGTISALAAGTITGGTLQNLVSGTINNLIGGTITNFYVADKSAGQYTESATEATGQADIRTESLSFGYNNVSGSWHRNNAYGGTFLHTLGTAGAAAWGTIIAAAGAGTRQYVSYIQVMGRTGTVDLAITSNVAGSTGAGVLARGFFAPGNILTSKLNPCYVSGTNGTVAYWLGGAGTVDIIVNYWNTV